MQYLIIKNIAKPFEFEFICLLKFYNSYHYYNKCIKYFYFALETLKNSKKSVKT